MIFATCATIAAALASVSAEPVALTGDCPAITISAYYPQRRTVIAEGANVRGLTVLANAGNLQWIGGGITAPVGMGANAADGYGAVLRGTDTDLISVDFTNAEKAVLLSGGARNGVLFSTFAVIQSDGIYVNGAKDARVIGNTFRDFRPRVSQCTVNGVVTLKVAQRTCLAGGGKWKDGSHPDPVQIMNGADNGLYALNDADTVGQGIGQFDLTKDLPLNRITIYRNKVTSGGYHTITLGRCNDCVIRDNVVATNNGTKTVVRFTPATTIACQNVAPVKSVAAEACK